MISVAGLTADDKQNDLLQKLGLQPWRPTLPAVIGKLEADAPALSAGLQVGDKIRVANERQIGNWQDVVEYVRQHPGQRIELQVERNAELHVITLVTATKVVNGVSVGYIGAAPRAPEPLPESMTAEVHYPLFEALGVAMEKTWQLSLLTLRMIGKMILGEVSLDNLSGPITIATYAGYTAAVISISLGVLNLLPVPMLDGGHLMYYLIEMVKGSPLSDNVQIGLQKIGIILLVMLMTLALYNDIARLFAA
jgi:regulator of sigma E protease